MNILFDNHNNGSEEVKELLGFVDADLNFSNIKPKIIPATDILIELIGEELYSDLVTIYNSVNTSDLEEEFLKRTQTIIILDAYRSFCADNDLSHTTNGRLNRITENEKIAFEWQIVKSDRKMERDYYKALDNLIKFMDKKIVKWKRTDAFKKSHDLFIRTAEEIDDFFNIDGSRLLFLKLTPGIRKAEREEILPRIGKLRFDELKSNLKQDTSIDEELLKLIKEALVYKSLAWGIPRMSAQLFPEGFLEIGDNSRLTINSRKSIEKNQAEAFSKRFESDARAALIEIEKYIQKLNFKPEPIQEVKFHKNNDLFFDC